MLSISAEIIRWVDDYQPGIVECSFTDAHGREWRVIEKLPVVTLERLDSQSKYPRPGFLACQQLSAEDSEGIVTVTTDLPWHINAVDGASEFDIRAHQLVEYDWNASS